MHGCLSWAADGHTLALISSGDPSPDCGVRLLDTAAPGTSLLATNRLVLPTATGPVNLSGNYWRQVLISADGQVISAVVQAEMHHASGRMPGVTQKALIAGQRDPRTLAALARGRMKAKHDELVEALDGMFDDHHGELACR